MIIFRKLFADTKKLYLSIDFFYFIIFYPCKSAQTYFGARHALETLSQLITFDVDNSLEDDLHIPSSVNIRDEPIYPYRGLLLDTSRNYYSIDSIKVNILL